MVVCYLLVNACAFRSRVWRLVAAELRVDCPFAVVLLGVCVLLCWLPCVFVGCFGVYLWVLIVVGMLDFLDCVADVWCGLLIVLVC